ncbi:aspartic peptidase domain-containing protein [Xylaria telfairii]|nr:aspartic peptidase domain-containing protein [Xylaria telfairii]
MIVTNFLPLVLICVLACATPCEEIKPLAFPITDVQILPNDPESLTKGIPAGVGTPGQNIVFLPWPELNNTWIYDEQPFCDPSIIFNDVICRVRRGNLYSEGNSSSYQKTEDIPSAGGAPVETQGEGAELGIGKLLGTSVAVQDSLNIGSVKIAKPYPFGVPRLSWDHGYTISHALGLGSNSTLLNILVQTNQIGSRVWSIFWGRMWVDPEDAIDGSLVLGGYDTQKIIGKNYTQPLDYSDTTGCWTGMKVQVSSVKLNILNGDEVELLPQNTIVDTCIVPQRQLLLEGPEAIVDAFENETKMSHIGRSFGIHWSAYLYEDTDIFDGDMTISLSSGLEARIPNNQYLVPFVEVDRNGSRVFNTSQRELLLNAVTDNPSTLGRYFFTGAYLMVNHDAGTFTMWAANPTRESTLISVVSTNSEVSCDNTTKPDPISSPMVSKAATLSAGSIAGIAVGVVAALAIVGVVVGVYFFRRRTRSNEMAPTIDPSNAPPEEKDVPMTVSRPAQVADAPHELHADMRPELAGDERQWPLRIYETPDRGVASG